MNITAIKGKMSDGLDLWASARIDDMVKANPALAIPSVYMKRAAHNIISRNREGIERQIDNLSLFIADEDGNINTETIFEDTKKMLSAMEPIPFNFGMIHGAVGGGCITIDLPDNIVTTIMFGSKKSLSISPDDLKGLAEILADE